MILSNAWIVTMDDAGTEHERGWLRVEDGRIAATGAGDPPEPGDDLHGAVVTPGFVNTHHHLYQTLTRARAADADLFTWLRTLYPVWARIDDEMEYAAARSGLAELALSGCSTVFDHHYVFPRGRHRPRRGRAAGSRRSSASGSSPRAARWTSASPTAACRPTSSSRRSTTSSPTPSASRRSTTATASRSSSRRARRSR